MSSNVGASCDLLEEDDGLSVTLEFLDDFIIDLPAPETLGLHDLHCNQPIDALLLHFAHTSSGDDSCSDQVPAISVSSVQAMKQAIYIKQMRRSALTARRQATYRERKKQEMQELRNEVAKLKKMLCSKQRYPPWLLKLRRCATTSKRISGWKGIALRQMEQRQKAESIRQELRNHVLSNERLIRSAFAAIEVRRSSLGPHAMLLPRQEIAPVNSDECALLQQMLTDMSREYVNAKKAFNESDMIKNGDGSYPTRITCCRQWDPVSERECLECAYTISEPFEAKKIANVVFDALPSAFGKDMQSIVVAIGDSSATFAMKYQSTRCVDGVKTPYEAYMVVRKFDEPDQTVLLWREMSRGVSCDLGLMQATETGWWVVRSHPGDSTKSVIQNVSRLNVDFGLIVGSDAEEQFELLARPSLSETECEVTDVARAIEDRMLGCARSKQVDVPAVA